MQNKAIRGRRFIDSWEFKYSIEKFCFMAHVEIRLPCCDNDTLVSFLNGYIRPCDKVIAKFVCVVIGEQSLESGVDGIHVRVLRLLEVDIRQHSPEHGRERNGTGDFASAHFGQFHCYLIMTSKD